MKFNSIFLYVLLYQVDSKEFAVSYSIQHCDLLKIEQKSTERDISKIDIRIHVHNELSNRLRKLNKVSMHDIEQEGLTKYSEYLKALDIELFTLPYNISDSEFAELVSNLPCVESVDLNKNITFIDNEFNISNISTDYDIAGTQNRYLRNSSIEINNKFMQSIFNRLFLSRAESLRKSGIRYINDPYYHMQWYMHSKNPNGVDIEEELIELKNLEIDPSKEVVIAVIDSGCNFDHEDMKDRMWVNPDEICNDGIDNDNNGYIDDCYGWNFHDNNTNLTDIAYEPHGSAVSAIIGAGFNNHIGITPICPMCKIMCLKFMSNGIGEVFNEVRAINYALLKKVKISNNSYGSYRETLDNLEYITLKKASKLEHLYITTAGNNGLNLDNSKNIHVPSNYKFPNMIIVGASDIQGKKTAFSNFGKNSVYVFAPGQTIMSISDYSYLPYDGTSFAAPIVSGFAGYLLYKYPILSTLDLINIIEYSCVVNSHLVNLSKCGGIINAKKGLGFVDEYLNSHKNSLAGINEYIKQSPRSDSYLVQKFDDKQQNRDIISSLLKVFIK